MEEIASWSEAKVSLFQHFQLSTVEFAWEEGNPLTRSIFDHCIINQCILLNFCTQHFKYKSQSKRPAKEGREPGMVQLKIFKVNFQTLVKQRFSPCKVLLVWDTTLKPGSRTFLETSIPSQQDLPILIPTAFILATKSDTKSRLYPFLGRVSYHLTKSFLIFVDLWENSVKLGSFANNKDLHTSHHVINEINFYGLSLESLPRRTLASFKYWIVFWEKLHFNLYHGPVFGEFDCIKTKNVMYTSQECGIFEAYYRYENCSGFNNCGNIYTKSLHSDKVYSRRGGRALKKFSYLTLIYPFITNHVDYTFQVLFPKVDFFDANLIAFLTPFSINVWFCIGATLTCISIWVAWIEGEMWNNIMFWKFSVFFEQDGCPKLVARRKFQGKILLIMWVLLAIFLRNFFNSSLYTSMTTEKNPTDYPKNELLDCEEFDLLLPLKFYVEVSDESVSDLPHFMQALYFRMLNNSYNIKGRSWYENLLTLENIANGKAVQVQTFSYYGENVNTLADFIKHRSDYRNVNKIFTKFAVSCEGDCDAQWNLPLMEATWLHKIVPKQAPYFKLFRFWNDRQPTFATFRFSRFLGAITQSGVYDYLMRRHAVLNRFLNFKVLDRYRETSSSSGRLLSQAFNARKRHEIHASERATKLSAFTGTIMLACVMLVAAKLSLIFELAKEKGIYKKIIEILI